MKQFLLAAILLVSFSASALADTFSLSLDGKSFTCTEGGTGGNACVCKKDGSSYIAVFIGDFYIKGGWNADGKGMIGCRRWIKENPDTCN